MKDWQIIAATILLGVAAAFGAIRLIYELELYYFIHY